MKRGTSHRCATSVQAGDKILLGGPAVGHQPIEATVRAIECVSMIPGRGHRPMLVIEQEPVEPGLRGWGQLRGPITIEFGYRRNGDALEGAEEGRVTRRLTLKELRAWACQAQESPMPLSLIDHLIRGVL